MRMLYNLLFILLLSLLSEGCSKPEPIVVRTLTLSENGVVFDSNGGSKRVVVTPFPEDVTWDVSVVEAEWYQLSVEGNAVVVTVTANRDAVERNSTFTIFSDVEGVDARQVAVRQEAGTVLNLSTSAPSQCILDSEGDSYTFTVLADVEWSVECDSRWLEVTVKDNLVTLTAAQNSESKSRSTIVTILAPYAEAQRTEISVTQQSRDENSYLKLLGQWEITATKWFYSPNGSLNELDYSPNQENYFLIFKMEQGEYGKTMVMKDFLYPGTSLEVRYDKQSGGVVIPFGWSVLSYDVFLYITLIGSSQFSFASLEVDALPSADYATLTLDMPDVDGFNYVGFGLWTYNDNDDKVALGYRSQPTMFPMGNIVFRKYSN